MHEIVSAVAVFLAFCVAWYYTQPEQLLYLPWVDREPLTMAELEALSELRRIKRDPAPRPPAGGYLPRHRAPGAEAPYHSWD